MKANLTRVDALPLAEKIAADLAAENDAITTLDAEVGDGDLGVTCNLGMNAVVALLPTLGEESVIDAEVRWSQKAPQGGFLLGLQFQRVRARETWALNQLMRDG